MINLDFQLVLDEGEELDRKMADKLITIYFSFFKASIKKGDIDSKLVRIFFPLLVNTKMMKFYLFAYFCCVSYFQQSLKNKDNSLHLYISAFFNLKAIFCRYRHFSPEFTVHFHLPLSIAKWCTSRWRPCTRSRTCPPSTLQFTLSCSSSRYFQTRFQWVVVVLPKFVHFPVDSDFFDWFCLLFPHLL